MRSISILAPQAQLICWGVKSIEQRAWTTPYRGPLLIHASGLPCADIFVSQLPKNWYKKYCEWIDAGRIAAANEDFLRFQKLLANVDLWRDKFSGPGKNDYEPFLISHAIIGQADLIDILPPQNLNFSDQKNLDWAGENCYNWVLANPVVFPQPIRYVRGRPKIWEYNFQEGG